MKSKDLNRFMKYVDVNGERSQIMQLQCWHWIGAFDERSRPRFHHVAKNKRARRALLEIITDQDLSNIGNVIALCQNRICVRPDHLLLCNDNDAKACGLKGSISLNGPLILRHHFDEGYAIEQLAVAFQVSVGLVRACIFEGSISKP